VHFAASDDLSGIFDRVRLDLLDGLHVVHRPITAPRSRPSWPAVSNEISLGMLSNFTPS
jgi:hypothetical protein